MFGNLFGGVTKDTFIDKRTVSAKPSDAFYGPKCLFCWGPYDDSDHTSVRILPCNHIMGRPCLAELIAAPNGDTCPTCRTPLFHPFLAIRIERYLDDIAFRIFMYLLPWMDWLANVLSPPAQNQPIASGPEKIIGKTIIWMSQAVFALLNADNVYFFANEYERRFTDLNIEMGAAANWFHPFKLIGIIVLHYTTGMPLLTFKMQVLSSWILTVVVCLWRGHGSVRGFRDQCTFLMVMVGAVITSVVLTFLFMHFVDYVTSGFISMG
jgi:hypothetical protein